MATTTPVDPAAWWILDSLREGGHSHSDVLAFSDYLDAEQDEAQVRRASGVNSTVGIDIPRPPGRLRRLLGW
jgi:hypothetical protein